MNILEKKAEIFADSKERRGCSYWKGLRDGYLQAFSEFAEILKEETAEDTLKKFYDKLTKL